MSSSSSTATISKCPNCGPEHNEKILTDPEHGEIICGNCGMVISEKIEDIVHPESRAYSLEETNKRARTGTPYSLALHDIGLSTIIGKENKDAWTLACFCLPLETYHIRLSSITIIVYNITLPSAFKLLEAGARVCKPGSLLFLLLGPQNYQWCPHTLSYL